MSVKQGFGTQEKPAVSKDVDAREHFCGLKRVYSIKEPLFHPLVCLSLPVKGLCFG